MRLIINCGCLLPSRSELIWIASSVATVILVMCGLRYRASFHPICRVVTKATDLLAILDQDATGSFTIHNDGQAALDYKVIPTCQCTKFFPKSGRVEPGHSESVQVEITPLKAINTVRPVIIVIQTTDPDEASHRVGFTVAKSLPWSGVAGSTSFGVLTQRNYRGQVKSLELSSFASAPPPPQLTVVGQPGYVIGKVVPIEPGKWRIEFRLQPDIPIGQYTTTFAIGTAQHPEIAHIPVFLRITENVALRPTMTMIGADETDPVTVEIRGIDCDLPASIVSVEEIPGVRMISTQQISPSRVQASLELSREYRASLPQKIRFSATDLGEVELLCIRSSTRPKIDRNVTHLSTEGSLP